ncbi:MAG: GGDEF domain-containing protein, partial [Sphaerochaeta sp.]
EKLRKLNAELLDSSMIDPLTKLKNRAYFNQLASEAKESADLNGTSFALLIVDLDHFKRVNDTYGHAAGDQVIISMAHAMKDSIGTNTVVARWGGEEFVLLLHQMDKVEAANAARMLCDKLGSLDLPYAGTVTVSIGVAMYRTGERVEDLFKRCDDALYLAKHLGRNRVQFEAEEYRSPDADS